MSRQKLQGFTLVEILIVVVIMAILAAVVIPQFSGSTKDAKKSTAEFNLGVVRSVIQTFRAHHEGNTPAFPTGATTIEALLKKTDIDGTINAAGALGPYLVAIPANPYTNSTSVVANPTPGTPPTAKVTASNGGWIYDSTLGNIWLDSDTQTPGEFNW